MQLKIKEFAHLFVGYQTRKGVDAQPDGSHLLLQIRDFDDSRNRVDWAGLARISPTGADRESILRAGDVLFLAKGSRNFAYAIPDSLPTPLLAGSYFFILRSEPRIHAPYLSWFLNQETARRYFVRNATTGAHMPIVRREHLENLEIPIPSLETQQKIVALAELADRQEKLLAELAEKKKALATAACLHAAAQPST